MVIFIGLTIKIICIIKNCFYKYLNYNIFKNKEEDNEIGIDPDLILQIFSPMITSQRIMNCHFSNRYSSMQCQNGTNIVFDEVNIFTMRYTSFIK